MDKIRLGKTGLMVSRVGIGGIPITRPPLDEAIKIVNRALDLGVNFIDTANGYSTSEERIGEAIEGRREDIILTTKTGAGDKETAQEHLKLSLKRLRTDYLDIWQLHGINQMEKYEMIMGPGGAWEAVQEALDTGVVRHIGFSSHSLEVALKLVATDRFETVQFPFNFISHEPKDELVPLAKKHDVGFIAMKPFAGGMIKDANLAIKYLLQYDNVLPDPGIDKFSDIEEIVDVVNGSWEPSQTELEAMKEFRDRVGTRFCRQCEYCMPCPQGVLIHRMMYLQRLYELWPPERFFNWSYVQGGVESAENCIQCGACEPKCPYQLPIREMIQENLKYYHEKRTQHSDLFQS
ncbi:MAG: aldo/keto reductase [Candidatus Bathyarchaeota archaeon]|nr:aldo/keto reductase [Candidatus Bathyarchaeota archaeon]